MFFSVLLTVFATSRTARADPIEATYEISIYERFQFGTNEVIPFFSTFPFTVEFSRASTANADMTFREYLGPYAFSPLPSELIIVTPPPPAGQVHFVGEGSFEESDGMHRRQSYMDLRQFHNFARRNYSAGMILQNVSQRFVTPPTLSTSSFLEYLGADGSSFSYYGWSLIFTPEGKPDFWADNSFQYNGTARLLSYSIPGGELPPILHPVPEPATIALVSGGLLGLLGQRRRSR